VALPIDAKINICTASGMVLDAFTPGRREYSLDPDQLEKNRESAGACFPSLQEYQQAIAQSPQPQQQPPTTTATTAPTGPNTGGTSATEFAQNSPYFRLTSFVTIGATEFNLYSLLYQDQTGNVRPLLRTYTPD
jgi:hypothetical protein